ncbi:hypothetical protein HD554DRAFT_783613 [Boletus coccyginus]|nr:hypothetical protein HD554DRAFT_783613 [Boletus coccyginus]
MGLFRLLETARYATVASKYKPVPALLDSLSSSWLQSRYVRLSSRHSVGQSLPPPVDTYLTHACGKHTYTKSDWQMWTAPMIMTNITTRDMFIDSVYKHAANNIP